MSNPNNKPNELLFYYFTGKDVKSIKFEVFPNGTNILIDDNLMAFPDNISLDFFFNEILQEIINNDNEKFIKNDYLLAA